MVTAAASTKDLCCTSYQPHPTSRQTVSFRPPITVIVIKGARLLPVDGSYQQSQATSIISEYNISIDRLPISLDTIGIGRYSILDTGIV